MILGTCTTSSKITAWAYKSMYVLMHVHMHVHMCVCVCLHSNCTVDYVHMYMFVM